jgi:hypothetical protein
MMVRRTVFLSVLLLVQLVTTVQAYVVGTYKGTRHFSNNGRYLFRVEDLRPPNMMGDPVGDLSLGSEDEVPAPSRLLKASLLRVEDATEELLWETYLPYPPRNCYVSNDGHYVVTAEMHYWVSDENRGLQILGAGGRLIRSYDREYVRLRVPKAEFNPPIRSSSGPDSWHLHQYTGFSRDDRYFIITLYEGFYAASYWSRDTGKRVVYKPPSFAERSMIFDLESGERVLSGTDEDPIFQRGMLAVWTDMLSSEDVQARLEAARGLAGRLGWLRGVTTTEGLPFAVKDGEATALPPLLACTSDPDPTVRAEVIRAIYRIDPERDRTIVHECARASEPELRQVGAELLMGTPNQEGFSLLVALLGDSDAAVVEAARTRLWNRIYDVSRGNNQGIRLLRDYLTEYALPMGEHGRNVELLIRVADGTVSLGRTEGQAAVARKVGRELALKIGIPVEE